MKSRFSWLPVVNNLENTTLPSTQAVIQLRPFVRIEACDSPAPESGGGAGSSASLGALGAAFGMVASATDGRVPEPPWLRGHNRITSKIVKPMPSPTAIARDIHD